MKTSPFAGRLTAVALGLLFFLSILEVRGEESSSLWTPVSSAPSTLRTVVGVSSDRQEDPSSAEKATPPPPLSGAEKKATDAEKKASGAEILPLGDSVSETDRLVETGRALLTDRKWADAKAHFETALRKYPVHPELERLYRMSRAHLEVEIRYRDESFCRFLAETNKGEITYLIDEVLGNIETWHVDAPDWDGLFRTGMDSFQIALTEDLFLRQNRVADDFRKRLAAYGESLNDSTQKWSIHSQKDLKDGMFRVAETVQRNTGVSGISVIMEILCGMVNSLDTYSAYLTLGQFNDIYSMIDGQFVGLGVYVEVAPDEESLRISKVIVGSPAEDSGLIAGDEILAVDGHVVTEMEDPQEAGALLQGPEGSEARLRIRSKDRPDRNVRVLRRCFEFPSVENAQFLPTSSDGQRIAYLKINAFQKTTVTEVRQVIGQFERQGLDGLLIDLRNNPGGLLNEAVDLSNLFLENGTIVRTRGRGSEQIRRADSRESRHVPLVILIDENSASAAEIFAGAIQENGRGTVVGTRSFGKGTIQAIIQLENSEQTKLLAGLRLTTEKFYSPKGRAYSGVGVLPDIDLSQRYAVAKPSGELSKSFGAETSDSEPSDAISGDEISGDSITGDTEDLCLEVAAREARRLASGTRNASEGMTSQAAIPTPTIDSISAPLALPSGR